MAATPQHAVDEAVTDRFLGYRELLFSVVYTMLGSVADTEDVLQEVWLAWAARHRRPAAVPVDNPRAYLVRVAANTAPARRPELNRRRETYVGQWLPEPLVAGDDDASTGLEHTESLSMALLVVLETLSPLERAVFVLHDVFGFGHPEIARILDRSPAPSGSWPAAPAATSIPAGRAGRPSRRCMPGSPSGSLPPPWEVTYRRCWRCWRRR